MGARREPRPLPCKVAANIEPTAQMSRNYFARRLQQAAGDAIAFGERAVPATRSPELSPVTTAIRSAR